MRQRTALYGRLSTRTAVPRSMAFANGTLQPALWPSDPMASYEAHVERCRSRIEHLLGPVTLPPLAATPFTATALVRPRVEREYKEPGSHQLTSGTVMGMAAQTLWKQSAAQPAYGSWVRLFATIERLLAPQNFAGKTPR